MDDLLACTTGRRQLQFVAERFSHRRENVYWAWDSKKTGEAMLTRQQHDPFARNPRFRFSEVPSECRSDIAFPRNDRRSPGKRLENIRASRRQRTKWIFLRKIMGLGSYVQPISQYMGIDRFFRMLNRLWLSMVRAPSPFLPNTWKAMIEGGVCVRNPGQLPHEFL